MERRLSTQNERATVSDAETAMGRQVTKNGKAPAVALRYRRAMIAGVHIVLFALSLVIAFALAYNFRVQDDWPTKMFLPMLPVVLVIKLVVFGRFGLYHGWWCYVSLQDLIRITFATHVSLFFFICAFFSVGYVGENISPQLARYVMRIVDFERFRQVIFALDWGCTIALVSGVRLAVRLYHEEFRQLPGGRLTRLLIVGAGNAGELALREIHRMPVQQYDVIGLLDDDPTKLGVTILGYKVLGGTDMIREICDSHQIDEVLLGIPSAPPKVIRGIVQSCEGMNLLFRTLPAMTDVISGKVKVSQIRDVDINDLLGRAPAKLDTGAIREYIQDKVVMITGAGGSIGSEMCRQVAKFNPARLVLVEQVENSLFHIERELQSNFPTVDIKAYICDIYDRERIDAVFSDVRPMVVFHAAAHKHVPLMEQNPCEAVKNNVFGTKNCADSAIKSGCEKFVMISTDKAVNPTSVMGCSKRVAEMYIQTISAGSRTQFVTVRFGNVLGSNGSVVPIFKQQIAQGGPVTVTHPEMRRYFMTIPEASQLVMQAAALGKGGVIFLLDMGEPVKIVDLARDLIVLSGFSPGDDIEIVFPGIRPGEKLFEELSTKGEDMAPTSHEKIAVWKHERIDLETFGQGLDELAKLANCNDGNKVRDMLKRIVPEYLWNGETNSIDQPSADQSSAR